jgi:predicted amidohydrolase YtcJ
LGGHRVVPGFNDAHVHFFAGGADLTGPQLRRVQSKQEFQAILAAYARRAPKGQWITGGNWDHENWAPPELPSRDLIDSVTADTPVFVNRLDGHMALANSLALRLAGIDRQTKDIPGGVIVRDSNGEPTGILKDAAQGLVQRVIPSPSIERIRAALIAASSYANSQGVTSVQDMSATPDILRVYESLANTGELSVRVSGHQPLTTWKRQADIGLAAHFGSSMLQIGALKGFADGSLGSTTALLFQPYLDAPNSSGIPSAELADPDSMWRNMEGADRAGLQIAVHAIGDKANDTILNMYERILQEHGARDRRSRIEHAQHLIASDIPRFAQLHVIASMQPYHLLDDGHWAEKRIGPERAKTAFAFRSLLNAKATLAFGSDWPVAPMNELMAIYGAVTRRTLDGQHQNGWIPEQRISVAEAVRAFTYGSAYASFNDDVKGTLEAGKLADLVVLSEDIFTREPNDIGRTKVILTMLGGKVVYRASPNDKTTVESAGLR